MNRRLVGEVIAPPIPAFKRAASQIKPPHGLSFDLTQAVPWFPLFANIRAELPGYAQELDTDVYSAVLGLPALREAIPPWHPMGAVITPDQIVITAGANHAIYTLLTTLFNHGDTVVLPTPYYFNHDMALRMMGMSPSHFPMSGDAGFTLDGNALVQWLKQSAAKGVILVSPNNPTGALYRIADLVIVLEWASSHDVQVILDETYLAYDGMTADEKKPLHRFMGKNLHLVGSFSKTYGMTGYRVGYLVSGTDVGKEIAKVQDTMIIAPCTLSQKAALFGIRQCADDIHRRVGEMAQFRDIVCTYRAQLKKFSLPSVGVFFSYLQHPWSHLDSSTAALELYRQTGILGLPGSVFGPDQESYIRLAYCNLTPDDLHRACQQLLALDVAVGRETRGNTKG